MRIVLGSVKARRAYSPNSLPMPDCLRPPKGTFWIVRYGLSSKTCSPLVLLTCIFIYDTQLMPTTPVSRFFATRRARVMSRVNTPDIKPYLLVGSSAAKGDKSQLIHTLCHLPASAPPLRFQMSSQWRQVQRSRSCRFRHSPMQCQYWHKCAIMVGIERTDGFKKTVGSI